MSIFKWWTINHRIIKMLNSCNYKEFSILMEDLVVGEKEILHYLSSRFFIWRWIRPRDFYKMSSMWIAAKTKSKDTHDMEQAEWLLKAIMKTTSNDKIKETFVWNLTKSIPILTYDIVPYISYERLYNMLTSNKKFVTDQIMQPFLHALEYYAELTDDEE